ncbi:hypothetical protein OG429_38440 [Streptomyces sp. NBC_00190]|uniref:hypothetical protein n=1 Tax=Streptomyces sp. NBC_00190 TaxID=2903634 RepID=UPI002E2D7B64|nr:hypothetical protein [Streptomyces sp. NBC_00190]
MVLRPPVEPMLAQAAEAVPPAGVLRAGVACRSSTVTAPCCSPRPRPQRRHPRGPHPAYFIAFDVLQMDGQELLRAPYRYRRTRWRCCSPITP